jgi:hypothetical protein
MSIMTEFLPVGVRLSFSPRRGHETTTLGGAVNRAACVRCWEAERPEFLESIFTVVRTKSGIGR